MLIQCPECKQQISEQAASCPKCGRPVSDGDRERAKAAAETLQKTTTGCGIGCLALVVLVIIIGAIGGRETPGPRQPNNHEADTGAPAGRAAPSEAERPEAPTVAPNVGDGSYLRLPDSDAEVVLAVDLDAFDEFVKASVATDKYGIAELMLAGRIFSVASGTRVLVIETKLFKNRVRIVEGPETGQAGWVPFEWVCSEPGGK